MNIKEIDALISDLEVRLDRLRALYEQYFMGYEKLEPQVQRKDVDRRFQILRKENFRNTALRFRLNVAAQKYSTYQMYWGRICRQIEEGTYKRHVQRAKARFEGAGKDPAEFDIDVDLDDAFLDELERRPPSHDDDHATLPPPPRDTDISQMTPHDSDAPKLRIRDAAPVSKSSSEGNWFHDLMNSPPPEAHEKAERGSSGAPSRAAMDGPFRAPPMPHFDEPKHASDSPATARGAATDPPAGGEQLRPTFAHELRGARRSPPPTRTSAAQATPRPATPATAGLSDARIRELYTEYVRGKRERGESTASTTFENVAKSLRVSSEQLGKAHQGKKIDFEVTEHAGRTVLKPVIRE